MKILPKTLFGQLLLALCIGLIAVQATGIWLTLDDRATFGQGLLGTFAAQRIAGVISIIDAAEPVDRRRLVRALNVPPTHVSIDEPWAKAIEPANDEAKRFIEQIDRELPKPTTLQIIAIKTAPSPQRRRETGTPQNPQPATASTPTNTPLSSSTEASIASLVSKPPAEPETTGEQERRPSRHQRNIHPVLFVVGQARLTDGSVLTFHHSLPDLNSDEPLRLLVMLAVLAVSITALSAWAVRRLTQPLASLADAATGLALNLERPPLPETGPLEVALAAKAFNSMQHALNRYLKTRAQALAAVSHDLRLPITRLRLRMEKIADAELRAKMESDLIEMDDMIGNTLEYLRAGSISEKTSRIDINALIESITEDMITLGAQITQTGSAPEPLLGRPQALRRCMTNLMENAFRYGGGKIDISIATIAATSQQQDMLEIRIEDRGPGIPESDLERVFEPYVRLESSRSKYTGGSGLGLTIAQAIVRSHGGDLVLKARPSGGTSAILTLPRTLASD